MLIIEFMSAEQVLCRKLVKSTVPAFLTGVLRTCAQAFIKVVLHVFSEFHRKNVKQPEVRGEIRLVTSWRPVWSLWLKVFRAHVEGRLINPNTKQPYNYVKDPEKTTFRPQTLSPNTFRVLAGLDTEGLKECANKILTGFVDEEAENAEPAGTERPVPKIFLGKPGKWVRGAVSLADWVYRKRLKSTIVRKIAHYIGVTNMMYDKDGEFISKNWSDLKKELHITSAQMSEFIRRAGHAYLGQYNLASLPKSLVPLPDECLAEFARVLARDPASRSCLPPALAVFPPADESNGLEFFTASGTHEPELLPVKFPFANSGSVVGGIADLR